MKLKRRLKKLHNAILLSLDGIMVMSIIIGVSALDCETNDPRIMYSMVTIPLVWGLIRSYAERCPRR